MAGTLLAVPTTLWAWRRALARQRPDLGRLTDLAAPLLYGLRCWADALFGYRPGPIDEPEITA